MRVTLRCLPLLSALVLPAACGGGGAAGGAQPETATGARHGESTSDRPSDSDADSGSEPESDTAAAEGPKGPSCDDGTCSKCGSGICPAGWYCDEKAPGGAACSWLTECAEKPSCGCVTRVLGSSCKCREEGGGLKVACD